MRGDDYPASPHDPRGLPWPAKLVIAAVVNIACFVGLWVLGRSLGYDPIGQWQSTGALPQSPIERLALVALAVIWLAINVRYLMSGRGGSGMLGIIALVVVVVVVIFAGAAYILLQRTGGSLPW